MECKSTHYITDVVMGTHPRYRRTEGGQKRVDTGKCDKVLLAVPAARPSAGDAVRRRLFLSGQEGVRWM